MNRLPFLHSLTLFCLISLCSAAAFAQKQSVGLSPASVDAEVERGKIYTQEYTVNNQTTTRVRFRATAADIWYDEKNQPVEDRAGTLPHSAATWIQFNPAEIIIEPMSAGKFTTIITVPENASGGHYARLFFDGEAADQPKEGSAATVAFRLGGLLLLATANSIYRLEVVESHVSPPTAATGLKLTLDVANLSNSHILLRGSYALLDANNRVAGRGKIVEKRYFPGQRQSLEALWGGELKPGNYTAIITLTYPRAGTEPATTVHQQSFVVLP